MPNLIIVILSATSLTSLSLWVMKIIEVPLDFKTFITLSNSSVSWGVSTAVGSSKIKTLASYIRALTISTRCCTPTGKSSIIASGSISNLNSSDNFLIFVLISAKLIMPNLDFSRPSAIFSATVKTGINMKCWCTIPMPYLIASDGS